MFLNNTKQASMIAAGVAGMSLFAASAALAEGPNLLDKGFYADLGTFIVNTDTTMTLNGQTAGEVPGKPVNWEHDFGKGDVTRFRFDGEWRFADRHKIRAMIFDYSHSKSTTINDEIDWDGTVYPINANVEGKMSFSVYELAYEYAFMRRPDFEVTGSIGLHYTDFKAKLSGTWTTSGEGGGTVSASKEGSVGAPLPVIGVRGLWRIGGDFWLDAMAQYFAMNIDGYDGHLSDLKAVVMWQPVSWGGVGIGYNRFGVDVTAHKDKFNGNLNWAYQGPQIFYSVKF